MTPLLLPATLLVVLVGATLAFQAPVNAALARTVGDPVWAATISFGVGFAILLSVAIMRGTAPVMPSLKGFPIWILSGGLLGAIWVLAAIWSVPRLGAVTMFAAMILGQMIAAMIIDAHGSVGLDVRNISLSRLVSVVLISGGVILSMR